MLLSESLAAALTKAMEDRGMSISETTNSISSFFRSKTFKVDTRKPEEYESARSYGRSLGIPENQLDFTPP
jgi:hypothetical protein